MNEHLQDALDAKDRGDMKRAEKSMDAFTYKVVVKGQASDEDALTALSTLTGWAREAPPFRLSRRPWDSIANYVRLDRVRYPACCEELDRIRAAAEERRTQAAAEAHAEKVAVNRAAAATRMLMTTTPTIPGREIAEPLTVVSGACVMSRNALSDFGSDLSSVAGGQLSGIEKAVEKARLVAMERIEAAAYALGADAVVGIDTSVQTVSDKAQLVMMFGTAVTLAPLA